MSGISTLILDVTFGKPAADVQVRLEVLEPTGWQVLVMQVTDVDGRCKELLDIDKVFAGTYRIVFATGSYFAETHRNTFYPEVTIVFTVSESRVHYHVPLLLSPFGYTTYRGS
ncbi:MAG: hydroxyisourate hydrolase [Acidobacteriaceae bacterium]